MKCCSGCTTSLKRGGEAETFLDRGRFSVMSEGRSRVVVTTILFVLALYAIPMGLIALPVGLFVGPELTLAAICHLLVGATSAVLSWRLIRNISD